MKKIILCSLFLAFLTWGCPHHEKTDDIQNPPEKGKVVKELFLERIKPQNCNGSSIEAKFKKGEGMFQDMIVVSGCSSIIIAMDNKKDYKVPVDVDNDFLVNKNLDYVIEGDWDGKCVGARHTIIGNLTFYDYEFRSDTNNPLIFMMSDMGYQYIQGKGEVKDMISGEKFVLTE
jgi:hypothetical protein